MKRPFSYILNLGYRYPIRLVLIAIALTLLLFVPTGWSAWQAYFTFQNEVLPAFQLQKQIDKIIYLDELLTMSARMNAATGNTRWEQRYRLFEPQYDASFAEILRIAPEAYEGEWTKETDAANSRLEAIEYKAFDLVRQGKPEPADQLLSSPDYERNKQIYAIGFQKSVAVIQARIRNSLTAFRGKLLLSSGLAGVSLLIITPIWTAVLVLLRRYLRDREQARQLVLATNAELEVKVAARTADLVAANQEIVTLNEQLRTDNRRMQAELSVVQQIQQMILPKANELETIPDLDIVGYMQPADEVGGDYYDVFCLHGIVTVGIGDVTGHGLESGILMVMTQTAVRTLTEMRESNPVEFLSALNRTLFQNIQRMQSWRNLTLAVINYADGTASISGQHEEVLVVRSQGTIERVDTLDLGFPIGMIDDITEFVAQRSLTLNPGDGIVMYTDGITEMMDANQNQYGIQRLCNLISHHWQASAEDIKTAIVTDLHQFRGDQKLFDDLTLVVLKRRTMNEQSKTTSDEGESKSLSKFSV